MSELAPNRAPLFSSAGSARVMVSARISLLSPGRSAVYTTALFTSKGITP
jgi:hypothetical protein